MKWKRSKKASLEAKGKVTTDKSSKASENSNGDNRKESTSSEVTNRLTSHGKDSGDVEMTSRVLSVSGVLSPCVGTTHSEEPADLSSRKHHINTSHVTLTSEAM